MHGVDAYGNPNEHSRTEVREGPVVKGEKLLNNKIAQLEGIKLHPKLLLLPKIGGDQYLCIVLKVAPIWMRKVQG